MAKLPSFQFYPGDWLKDPQLRMASLSSKGIWIDLLCAMFEAQERGALEATNDQFCKLLGCTADEFIVFLREARTLKFANVREMSADSPATIRIESRRMLRDEKQRQTWGNQKRRQRHPEANDKASANCLPNVRDASHRSPSLSSSSSSSSKKENKSADALLPTSSDRKKKTRSGLEYSPEFEQAYALYPLRPAGDSKPAANKAFRARIAEGISASDLIAGAQRYATYIRETGSQFVKQAATFFGPDEHWKQPWKVTNGNGRNGTSPVTLPPTADEFYRGGQS